MFRTKKRIIQDILNLVKHPPKTPSIAPDDKAWITSKGFNFDHYRDGKGILIVMERDQERAERILKDFDQDKIHMLVIEVVGNERQ